MSDRFSKLYELQRNLYREGSLVIVSAGTLLKDTQTSNVIVQLKFHSISATAIKALKVGIAAFDIAGKEIAGVSEYQYLDLSIQNGQEFGSNKAIVMPDPVTRSFAINSMTIVLADGHVQNVRMPLSPLPQPAVIQSVLTGAELVNQYRLKTNDRAAYVPQESTGLWQCHCGQWNGYSVCSKCRGQKSTAFAALDLPTLTNEMKVRLAEEARKKAEAEQRAVLERQEKEKQLAIKEEHRKATAKKAKKALAIVVPVLALVIAFVTWVYPDVIKPNMMYKDASALLLDGQYDAATTAFLALGDYKDAQQMSLESQYQKAEQFLEEQQYEDAFNIFEKLGEYSDSSKRAAETKDLFLAEKYKKAVSLYENGSYEDALIGFDLLGTYKDSKERYAFCEEQIVLQGKYENAIMQYENSYFTLAYELFVELGDYKDSSNLAQQCKQQIGDIDQNNVLMLFPMIDYEISLKSLCAIMGSEDYESGIRSFSNGWAYRSFAFGNNFTLNGIPSEVSFRFRCEYNDTLTVEDNGVLIGMGWSCPDDLADFDMYQSLKKYIISVLGTPTKESTSENNYGKTYAYYTYWGDMQLYYSSVAGDHVGFGRYIYNPG